MVKKFLNRWCKIDVFARLVIIGIVLGVVIFGVMACFEDWSLWKAHEESYVKLEQIAYDISENRNFNQPLSDNLKEYKIECNKDGTIDIELYAHDAAYLKLTLNDNYNIQEMRRASMYGLFTIIGLIVIFFVFGFCASVVIHLIYWAIEALCKYIVKIKNEVAEEEKNKSSEKDNN